jgi:hypothetical protein
MSIIVVVFCSEELGSIFLCLGFLQGQKFIIVFMFVVVLLWKQQKKSLYISFHEMKNSPTTKRNLQTFCKVPLSIYKKYFL